MKKLKITAVFALSLTVVGGCTRGEPSKSTVSTAGVVDSPKSQSEPVHPSGGKALRKAPAFTLKDKQGKEHHLAEFAGAPVMLHFWASWCPPCLEELPAYLEMVKARSSGPIRFVAISLDKSWAEAEKILPVSAAPSNLVYLLDEKQKVPEDFGSFQFPETYLLNQAGEIVDKWVGAQDWKSDAMINRIAQDLGGSK